MFANKLALIALLLSALVLPAQAQSFNSRYDRGSFTHATDTRLARVMQVSPVEIERRGMNTGTVVGALLGGHAWTHASSDRGFSARTWARLPCLPARPEAV